MKEFFYDVAVNAPIKNHLTYSSTTSVPPGTPVKVPLGQRSVEAVIMGENFKPSADFKIKPIRELREDLPALPASYLKWVSWLAKYYLHPVGQVLQSTYPPLKKSSKKRSSNKSPVVPLTEKSDPLSLTTEQEVCFSNISKVDGFATHLLHGVTGSGKTEVYLRLLEKVLADGLQALILVPEISLTPQLVNRFSARFPNNVAVIHSHLTEREKTEQWWAAFNREKNILIGARSALFCPLEKIGIIIVDEEHEPSFKQEEKLKYHARDAAIMRARFLNVPIVLGSATPSLESWHNAKSGKFHLHSMASRVSNRPMPDISVVNIKDERKNREGASDLPFWLSTELYIELSETLKKGKQAALFLNRRGVAQTVQCHGCGFVFECPNCAISLTLHAQQHLVCHYCNYTERLKEKCPKCQTDELSPLGLGTEQVEKDIQQLFPEASIARADRDEITRREQLEDLISNMEKENINILIGTQMIAKGLDFPGLDLVGLVLADVGFHIPDFRASERSFQLLTQVSGRAGRHTEYPGKVIIQTYSPDQASIIYTVNNDFVGFAEQELLLRQELSYPPFGRLACFRIVGNSIDNAERAAQQLANRVHALKEHREVYNDLKILGPCPAPIAKIRNKYRYHLLIKATDAQRLRTFVGEVLTDQGKCPAGTKVQIDIDPMNML